MSSKKQPAKAGVCKGKKEAITVEVKKEIIAKHERGIRVADLAREYGRAPTTISTILKGKDKYKTLDVAKGVSKLTSKRPKLLEDVEWLLLVWMNERQLHGDCVSEAIVCAKARMLYVDLVRKIPGASSEDEEVFRASRGWFENFKKRSGIHSGVRHGEAASSDKGAAEAFVPEFQKFVDQEQFLPQQVFNCDETGLFWKKTDEEDLHHARGTIIAWPQTDEGLPYSRALRQCKWRLQGQAAARLSLGKSTSVQGV
nr:tigger transposable element-derived protein 1-like [Procambarus clarkii]